jgi:Ca2+-transporting ATPase
MDSLAAIALASEPADERVLLDKPRNKSEFIINKQLGKAIFGFGGFVWLLCIAILWGMEHLSTIAAWGCESLTNFFANITPTVFFATYMTINWWNMFNARVIGKNKSIFSGLFNNSKFIGILIFILAVTILIVQIGGEVFQTQPLDTKTWLWIILLTSPIAWVRELYFQLIGKRKNNQ